MTPEEQRNRLLNELQSLQNVLNKTDLSKNSRQATPNTQAQPEIIPILQEVHEPEADIPVLTQQVDDDELTPIEEEQTVQTSAQLTSTQIEEHKESDEAHSVIDNPYLPRDIIERLASQASSLSQQIKKMDEQNAKQAAIEEAAQNEMHTKTSLISEEQKQLIINELIEDMLPTLMKQLRARLNALN